MQHDDRDTAPERRSADDTAADMARRLHALEDELEETERKVHEEADEPLIHLAGDQTEHPHEPTPGEPSDD